MGRVPRSAVASAPRNPRRVNVFTQRNGGAPRCSCRRLPRRRRRLTSDEDREIQPIPTTIPAVSVIGRNTRRLAGMTSRREETRRRAEGVRGRPGTIHSLASALFDHGLASFRDRIRRCSLHSTRSPRTRTLAAPEPTWCRRMTWSGAGQRTSRNRCRDRAPDSYVAFVVPRLAASTGSDRQQPGNRRSRLRSEIRVTLLLRRPRPTQSPRATGSPARHPSRQPGAHRRRRAPSGFGSWRGGFGSTGYAGSEPEPQSASKSGVQA